VLPGHPDQEDLLWAELAKELQESRERRGPGEAFDNKMPPWGGGGGIGLGEQE